MVHETTVALLKRVRELTENGLIKWVEEGPDTYSADMCGQKAYIEFLYIEATNRAGADRTMVNITLPYVNLYLASGTESFGLVVEILAAGIERWREHIADFGQNVSRLLNELETR